MSGCPARVVDLGLVPYTDAWRVQRSLVARRAAGREPDTLLLCQHPPVVTVGRSGHRAHVGPEVVANGVPVLAVERGGDVTYHGPGQLVGYPILSLEGGERDLHALLRRLEEAAIRTVAAFGIPAGRILGLTGVWVGDEKICAIGIAVRRWVTFHGFALNVEMDLRPFGWIVPCGLRDRGVTSMARALGAPVEWSAVQGEYVRHFGGVFGRAMYPADPQAVLSAASEAC
ncbi:MAG: lipoyl(octanoyl) transferase LipB [Armatimonadetes bacterium]|nr:lipoyl(octanoyl) transferase LipB [Armatimonadota bacterium]